MAKIENILQVNYIHLDSSNTIETYIQKKLNKHNPLLENIREIKFNLALENNRSGQIYRATMEIYMDHSGFVVKHKGNDVFGVIEQVSDIFYDRLNKMADRRRDKKEKMDWGGNKTQWMQEVMEEVNEYDNYNWNTVIPEKLEKEQIVEKFEYPNNSPIHVEEAIQIMEKYRRPFLMFRNIRTGKYSVVYRVDGKAKERGIRNGYGLVEPRSAS
jgi:ribosomal subunit interface protein